MKQLSMIAVGWPTDRDLDRLGNSLTQLWPARDAACFDELLDAIDEAEQQVNGCRRRSGKLDR